ncbi:hypothetical protein [Flavobacterium sp. FlaQc-30]|uniref:hypothetical protein n=1 Tax=Flavobacterium sp. FlaQc-30 TaxID=3374179 RepID=UPI003758053F
MNKLERLAQNIEPSAKNSSLTEKSLLHFPENLRKIHSYKVFGNDLLAIPTGLIMEGDDEEFEKPFQFLSSEDELETFEEEFREAVPPEFIQIGSLYGASEIVLLNKLQNTIHIFHVQDICETDWMAYKLQDVICTFEIFIENIRPQTVVCLMHSADYTQFEMFEIRNETEIYDGADSMEYSNSEEVWAAYFELVEKAISNDFKIHYAPKKVIDRFSN